jgi:hypothetical protein
LQLQLKDRSSRYQRNAEKSNSAASLLITQLFVALASSERMNRLVSSLPSTSWNASHISVLLRRVFDQHTTFFGIMLENNILKTILPITKMPMPYPRESTMKQKVIFAPQKSPVKSDTAETKYL